MKGGALILVLKHVQENRFKKRDVKQSSYWHDGPGQRNAYCSTRVRSVWTFSSGTATLNIDLVTFEAFP